MSAAIGPGDWVECVESAASSGFEVVAGRVYLVTGVGDGEPGCGLHGDKCRLDWLEVSGEEQLENSAWCIGQFRPIYRPNAKLIADLLTKVPAERVRA